MGIADDIRPKKYRRISKNSPEFKIPAAEKKAHEEIVKELFSKQNNDDFFANTPIENNGVVKKRVAHPKEIDTKTLDPDKQKSGFRWIYTLIIIIVILILIGLAVWQNLDMIKSYFNGSYKKQNDQDLNDIISSTNDSLKNYDTSDQNQTNQPATDQQNPATDTSTIDKSTIIISVLNGSGVKNSAKNVADILTAAGFNITNTSNAKSFNYATSYIYYKSGKETEANLVKEALADRTVDLKESDSIVGTKYDIVVVVGKK